jgi:hypothetical protein
MVLSIWSSVKTSPLVRKRESSILTLAQLLGGDAWSVLNSTVSRPFAAPLTGKIAVKVINHYGDEVMKVYSAA